MDLCEWLQVNKLSDSDLAKKLGHKRTDNVRRWKLGHCIPRKNQIAKLHQITNGQVTANDFYN